MGVLLRICLIGVIIANLIFMPIDQGRAHNQQGTAMRAKKK